MSADNWALRKNCGDIARTVAEKQIAELDAKLDEAYGNLPRAEYAALVTSTEQAKRMVIEERDERVQTATLREDYEFYGTEEGSVNVDYHGCCTECGYGAKYTGSIPLTIGGGR